MSVEVLSEKAKLRLSSEFSMEWKLTGVNKNSIIRTPVFKPLPNFDVSFLFEITYEEFNENNHFKDETCKAPPYEYDRSTLYLRMIKMSSSNVNESLKMTVTASVEYDDGTNYLSSYLHGPYSIKTMNEVNFPIKLSKLHNGYFKTEHAKLMDSGILHLQCQLKIVDDFKDHPMYHYEICSLLIAQRFAQNFSSIYKSNVLSDIVVQVEDKTLPAHKAVLVAHSSVFMKMLTQDFRESNTNKILITDVSFEVFQNFLKYLYSAEVEDKSWPAVRDLYAVAHKYDVATLKDECSRAMITLLNLDNVCEILQTAFLYEDENLKKASKRFAIDHIQNLVSKHQWMELVASQPHVGCDIAIEYLQREIK